MEPTDPLLISSSRGNQSQEEEAKLVNETWGESKKIWQIAGPTIFSRLAMFSLTVITQSFAGHLGNGNLAAISIVTTLLIGITFGLLLGMASAMETLCGQAYGAKQYHMLGIYLQRSCILLSLSSIALLPLFMFASPIVKLLGQSDDVAELTGEVAIWLIPMHLSFPFQFTLMRFLQCQLKTLVIAWVCGGTLLLHVVLNWVFVYTLRVGIVGTAIVLDISWWASVIGLVAYIVFGGCPHSWTGFSRQGIFGLWQFFKLSLASGVMLSLENFYFRVLIIVSGYMKNIDVSIDALSVCVTIIGWESMIPLGLFAATGIRVATELGAGNRKGARLATKVSLLNSFIIGVMFWLIIMAYPEKLAMIFTSNTAVIKMVHDLSFLLATTLLINCIQPILSGVAVGIGWQALVAYVNIGSYYLVGIPLGLFLGYFYHFGLKGIWIGMMCGTVVQTLILTVLTLRCGW
ncbi:unnamed protein product [Cuscuta epithymum]|uniref:Protein DETOXIFICATION n=1 Tax=Cuscuta epithymum TaxID=186058 RepID=A0AAV0GC00_9ASTE|nr:unnamed protein product [Cuscuta epithymum]CAH9145452.1 unnamed protein product [Cuscuta epithymum]